MKWAKVLPFVGACVVFLSTSCASSRIGAVASSSVARQHGIFIGYEEGGTYRWTIPKVTFPGPPVAIEPSAVPDPITGRGQRPLAVCNGPMVVQGDRAKLRSKLRVHVLVQSWNGRIITHNTWRDHAGGEPLPSGALGDVVFNQLYLMRLGCVMEYVLPATQGVPGIHSTSVLIIQLDPA